LGVVCERVPQLYADAFAARRAQRMAGQGRLVSWDRANRCARYITRPSAAAHTQQPSLFDYKRGADTRLVTRRRHGADGDRLLKAAE
jgi:hypothetical protein